MLKEIDLSREAYAAMILPIQEALATKYGCLAVLDGSRPTKSRGTVVFVASDEGPYLLTAKHVLEGLWEQSEVLHVLRATAETKGSVPEEHIVNLSSLVWSHHDLDVALLRAPASLVNTRGVGWFSLERGRQQMATLRACWSASAAPYLTFAAGFPNFGRLAGDVADGVRAELLGMLVLPAGILSLGKTPDARQTFLQLLHDDPFLPG